LQTGIGDTQKKKLNRTAEKERHGTEKLTNLYLGILPEEFASSILLRGWRRLQQEFLTGHTRKQEKQLNYRKV
jgi:hypothetical protein